MKIAIVIERLEAWRGGAETSTLELARLLVGRGHDVHIVTATNAQSRPDMAIHHVPPGALLPALRMAGFVRNAEAFVRQESFDIVHAITPLRLADVYQPRGGLLRETLERNVATRRSASRRLLKRALLAMNVKQRSLLDLERRAFDEGGPSIAAVSEYVARQCERNYGVGPPRVRVVFNGVNVSPPAAPQRKEQGQAMRKQYRLDDDTLVLLFMAHNFRLKGLSPMIDTLSAVVSSGMDRIHLLVVGRDNPVRFQRKLDAMGLARFVTFTGPTQRSAMFFCGADVVVHPTYYDPCSRVILEAIAYGVPCITTSFNGAAEVLTDGHDGFVIATPDERDAWANRIRQLQSPARRQAMAAAMAPLRERVSMSRHVADLEALYLSIRADQGRRVQSA